MQPIMESTLALLLALIARITWTIAKLDISGAVLSLPDTIKQKMRTDHEKGGVDIGKAGIPTISAGGG
mgnify:FL=1